VSTHPKITRLKAPKLPAQVNNLIDKWALRYNVDPSIAKAQAWQESRGRQSAVSKAECMASQLKTFKGNYSLALAAHNAGASTVKRAGGVPRIPETQNYVATIMRTAPRFSEWGGGTPSKGKPIRHRPGTRPSRLARRALTKPVGIRRSS
jgi:soluble lytic murein transglycosylase-like protein